MLKHKHNNDNMAYFHNNVEVFLAEHPISMVFTLMEGTSMTKFQ